MRRTTSIICALTLGVVIAIAGTIAWRDTFTVTLNNAEVPVPGLTREVRILHASDLHGVTFGAGQNGIAAVLGEQHFDAAVINGDHIPTEDAGFAPVLELLDVLQDHADVVFVTRGNHDTTEVIDALASHGAVVIEAGAEAVPFAARAGRLVVTPAHDARGVPTDADLVLRIGHYPLSPGAITAAADGHVGTSLFLFGHAHGGQIRLPLVGALWAPGEVGSHGRPVPRANGDNFLPEIRGRELSGMSRVGGSYRHISSGLGTQAIRLRFLAPAEMTVITLVPEV